VDTELYIANILSIVRLLLVPCCLIAACARRVGWFVAFFALTEICDMIDGPLARMAKPPFTAPEGADKKTIILSEGGTRLGAGLDYFGDFAAYIVIPISVLILWRGWMQSDEETAPIRITFWTTTGDRPRLETAFQGRDKARVLERCGEPDEANADTLFYRHLTFREPGERATTRSVRFVLSGDTVIHIEVGEETPF